MIRRRSHGAVLGVGLLAAMTVAAQSQSWNLYNGDTSLPTISFVGGAMSPTKAASVDLALGSASSPTPFVMDTGSTGIVVSSNFFTPGPNDVYVGQGTQTYTSSGKVEHGSFYLTNVVIYENSTTPLATARVTVLDVTSETCLSGYSNLRGKSASDQRRVYGDRFRSWIEFNPTPGALQQHQSIHQYRFAGLRPADQ